MGSSLISIGIVVGLIALVVIFFVKLSGTKRPCPNCHAMMPIKKTTCPRCGKAIPLNY